MNRKIEIVPFIALFAANYLQKTGLEMVQLAILLFNIWILLGAAAAALLIYWLNRGELFE